MNWTVTEKQLSDDDVKRNAGGKARDDLQKFFIEVGFHEIEMICPQRERECAGIIKKLLYHFNIAKQWELALSVLQKGDKLVLQFPVINHTLLLDGVIKRIKKKGIKIYAFIHDLESIRLIESIYYNKRRQWRMKKEELNELMAFDGIVVHNNHMRELLESKFGIPKEKMHILEIFDYITPDGFKPEDKICKGNSCIIAGNLKKEKAAYIYNLPGAPEFELYGINYDSSWNQKNLHYRGAYLADELPRHLKGKFGLVWDGDSIETCSGAWGEYLRYNNPHKASLYLACGIPIIIWEKAALADYVSKNAVGLTIKSLNDLDTVLSSITSEQYNRLKLNALKVSKSIRSGNHTTHALKSIGLI